MIRTVLGDIPPDRLGVCDAHDHLFMTSALLPGQELDSPAAAEQELLAYRELGGQAVVQWTPNGMGRRFDDLVAISRATGVHIVAATGRHQLAHSPGPLPDDLTELFVGELDRMGMIKVAGSFHGIDEHARRTMVAAAEAHHATGAPIGVHLELGTGALDVLELLCGKLGVPPGRVILGHLNRFPEIRVQRAAAASGAFLAFDGPSRANHATDFRLLDSLVALAEAGHTGQILLGGDNTTAAARGRPGMPYLLRTLRPAIERELGPDAAHRMFVTNPARAFDITPSAGHGGKRPVRRAACRRR